MSPLKELLELLLKALQDPPSRKETIRAFQSHFWRVRKEVWSDLIGEQVFEILADLAYDLDFFEPDPTVRAEDSSFYGHERLEKEIKESLQRLSQHGIAMPNG